MSPEIMELLSTIGGPGVSAFLGYLYFLERRDRKVAEEKLQAVGEKSTQMLTELLLEARKTGGE